VGNLYINIGVVFELSLIIAEMGNLYVKLEHNGSGG
jgi:hypothetical protein